MSTSASKLLPWSFAVALGLASIVALPQVAGAGAPATVEATGVSLDSVADCTRADLDLSMVTTGDVAREAGLTTNSDGSELFEFEHATGFDDYSGTYDGYGISVEPEQPDGTVIGSYAYIGNTPPDADTGEWFVLYRCSGTGPQEVLFTCFGVAGTCPTNAAVWSVDVDELADAVAGDDVVVSGSGCFADDVNVVLRDGDTELAVVEGIDAADGSWAVDLTVPGAIGDGTQLTVDAACGSAAQPQGQVLSSTFTVTGSATPPAPATTTTAPAATPSPTPAAAPTRATPTFTG